MTRNRFTGKPFLVFALCAAGVLLLLFWKSFDPRYVLFSNDGPLGAQSAQAIRLPSAYFGVWFDLNSIGVNGGSFFPNITAALLWLLGPLYTSKFYAVLTLAILGLCAWLCFRMMQLTPLACLLGGLAVMLSSAWFSTSCWGVGTQSINAGMNFLALGLLADTTSPRRWLRVVLAGFAVGMGVMEGADVGAILSVCIAAFVMWQALTGDGPAVKRLTAGIGRLAVVTLCAVFLAAQALTMLIGTQIKGVAGAQQDTRSRAERWDWATQWSLPKREALGFFIPGLFGYRMVPPPDDGSSYWGAVGRDAAWDRYFAAVKTGTLRGGEILGIAFPADPNLNSIQQVAADGQISLSSLGNVNVKGMTTDEVAAAIGKLRSARGLSNDVKVSIEPPQGTMRFSGGGSYEGVLVTLIALWAALQSFRRKDSVFSLAQRKFLWFWTGLAVVAVLLAFGRYAPFYWIVYQVPYFSTIRNPTKFAAVFNWAILVLFAYGIHGLSRRYLEAAAGSLTGPGARAGSWWKKAGAFDRRWVMGCAVAIVVSLLGWVIYASSRQSLEEYLQTVQFDASMAHDIAGFSIRQVGWFIVLLVASVGVMTLALSGTFAGRRARLGGILLGLILVVDLAQADSHWVYYWNYQQKYASNPIIDFLRQKPYEHRVAILPFRPPQQMSLLNQLYGIEWAQHQFLYYNIQSLDIVQMSRTPEDLMTFESALAFRGTPQTLYLLTRRWELTSTRYLLGPAGYLDVLNQQVDPVLHRFRIVRAFNIVPKPGIEQPTQLEELTAEPATNGLYALFEFTGALPRAKLYSHWQMPINNTAALDELKTNHLSADDLNLLQQVGTNDFLTLKELASPSFHPAQTVLLASPVPAPTNSLAGSDDAGTVEFSSYAPKDIKLQARADRPAVLLLNDKYDPDWQVRVDGKRSELLRCNYIMRGVYLPPGSHTVEFVFKPDVTTLYVSLSAVILAVLLTAYLTVSTLRAKAASESSAEHPPATTPAKSSKNRSR